jgi:ATPase complex subunit ATP10
MTIPDWFLRKNKSRDPNAQCTLLTVAFKEFGHQQTLTWADPFERAFQGNDRVEVFRLTVTEGWFNRYFLKAFITRAIKQVTKPEDRDTRLVYSATNVEPFCDPVRIHNLHCGYVFLLDGAGRVRFAGSGDSSEQEMEQLISYAKEFTPFKAKELLKPTSVRRPTGTGKQLKRNR